MFFTNVKSQKLCKSRRRHSCYRPFQKPVEDWLLFFVPARFHFFSKSQKKLLEVEGLRAVASEARAAATHARSKAVQVWQATDSLSAWFPKPSRRSADELKLGALRTERGLSKDTNEQ